MSRAFVKEDDAGEAPIIPPRAALPPNTPNYVSPYGLNALRQEYRDLELQKQAAELKRDNDADRTRNLTILKGQMADLAQRISSAKLIAPGSQSPNEVRFGATVCLKTLEGGKVGTSREFTIVGVDEADIKHKKIAFLAPLARTITGAKLGDKVKLKLGPRTELIEITSIAYNG